MPDRRGLSIKIFVFVEDFFLRTATNAFLQARMPRSATAATGKRSRHRRLSAIAGLWRDRRTAATRSTIWIERGVGWGRFNEEGWNIYEHCN